MKKQTTREVLLSLVDKLEISKKLFLNQIRQDIKTYISTQSAKDSLTIMTKQIGAEAPSVSWEPRDGIAYATRFIPFLMGKDFREKGVNYAIDSMLTPGIAKIIGENFSHFYQEKEDIIKEYAIIYLYQEAKIIKSIAQVFIEDIPPNSMDKKEWEELLTGVIFGALSEKVEGFQLQIDGKVEKSFKYNSNNNQKLTEVTPLLMIKISNIMFDKIKTIIEQRMGIIISNLMTMPIFQKLIPQTVAAIIIGNLLEVIIIESGLSIGAMSAIVLVPIFIGVLIYEYQTFSKKLAEKISTSVYKELEQSFSKINLELVENIFESIFSQQGRILGKMLLEDRQLKKDIKELIILFASPEAG